VGLLLTPLSNGNYVVGSGRWSGNRGSATWGNGAGGISGVVSDANSLVGSSSGDDVGYGITALSNGNYVVTSPFWNGSYGAATWGNGAEATTGVVSEANSLVGSNTRDLVGGWVIPLSNGNYVVSSFFWNANQGAATWVDGSTGLTLDGNTTITPQNSLLGQGPGAGLGYVVDNPTLQTFLAAFPTEGSGRVAVGSTDPNLLTFGLGQTQTLAITPEFLTRTLNTGTAVVLQASNDIILDAPLTVAAGGGGGSLTLQAGRSILINASISTDNGDLTLIANDQLADGVIDSQRDPGVAVITMAGGTTSNTGSGTLTVELRDGAGSSHPDSGAVTLQTVVAGSISVTNNGPNPSSDVILGPVTTTGSQSYANPNGTTRVMGDLVTSDSPVTFHDSVVTNAGVSLRVGAGTVDFDGGTAAASPGLLTIAGSLALGASATWAPTLAGTDPGSYSQVVASGPIDLGGSTLNLTFGYFPQRGDTFTLLTSEARPISGTFAGLDEGAIFMQAGFMFQITYRGGPDGKSVVLTTL
jgi:hypothetical protein